VEARVARAQPTSKTLAFLRSKAANSFNSFVWSNLPLDAWYSLAILSYPFLTTLSLPIIAISFIFVDTMNEKLTIECSPLALLAAASFSDRVGILLERGLVGAGLVGSILCVQRIWEKMGLRYPCQTEILPPTHVWSIRVSLQ
jgi:hypothetical protein